MTLADRLIVMNAGVADQIGTPMDVYDRPASVFVAGFIGSPAMNFLAGKGRPGRQVGRSAGTNANGAINMPLARPTSAPAGSAVALGVRPEHLHPAADGPLRFEVELAEPLGADTLLHGRFGAARELVTVRRGRPCHRPAGRDAGHPAPSPTTCAPVRSRRPASASPSVLR